MIGAELTSGSAVTRVRELEGTVENKTHVQRRMNTAVPTAAPGSKRRARLRTEWTPSGANPLTLVLLTCTFADSMHVVESMPHCCQYYSAKWDRKQGPSPRPRKKNDGEAL